MKEQDFQISLAQAMEAINDCLGAEFLPEKVILQCFQTENKVKVFQNFCTAYFPYRLTDDYKAGDYFDFFASAFVSKNSGGTDGIMLRTDIDYSPAELHHVFLHELAHIFCVRNELNGRNFYDRYCVDYATTKEEDGMINAGYAIWREVIAEVIAIECDNDFVSQNLSDKTELLKNYKSQIDQFSGKLFVSMLLIEIMTSSEVKMSETWEEAIPHIRRMKLFNEPFFLDLCQTVFVQLQTRFLKIEVDFIQDIGFLYLGVLSDAMMQKYRQSLTLHKQKEEGLIRYF